MGTLYYKIIKLCEEKGIKGGKLCTDIGISKGILTDLKKGRQSGISTTNAQKIASYFGVSVEYLLGDEDKKIPGELKLTEDEAEWLSLFREVPEESKGLLLETFKTFRKIPQDHQPEALNLLQVALRMQQKSE